MLTRRWRETYRIRNSPPQMPCIAQGLSISKMVSYERAIEAYDNLFENAPESVWRNEAVYQQAVCFRSIREFGSGL